MSEPLKQGFTHFRAGRLKEASQCFEEALAADPHNVEALNNLGVITFQQKEMGRAAQFFSQALEQDPFYLDAVINLCQVLRATGRLTKALPLLDAVVARYPDNKEISDLISEIKRATAVSPSADSGAATDVSTVAEVQEPDRQQAPAEVSLRKCPYPYRAAFTISNDIDLTNWRAFVDIYSFLCQTDATNLGQGLGLPLSSSFFLFNCSKRDQFAYFADEACSDGPQREQIEHLINTGYLDNIHGFGSFTNARPFKRELAERAYRCLAERGLQVPIWSCHGDEFSAAQVDSSGKVTDARGDDSRAAEYHSDLTREHGVRYIWQWHEGGISDVIGQEQSDFVNFGDKQFVPISASGRKHYRPLDVLIARQSTGQNSLLTPITLKDGSRIYNFRRFNGGLRRCNAATLAQQLRPEYLTELIQNGAYLLLYQHLGGARTSSDGPPVVNQPPYFSTEARAALLYVSELFREGHLWVGPLVQLLDFNYLSTRLQWRYEKNQDWYTIVIEAAADRFLDRQWLPTAAECAGLTFYTPDAKRTRVFLGDKEVDEVVQNAPDHTGRASVSIPMKRVSDFAVE